MPISKLSIKTTPLVPLLHMSDPGAFVDTDGDPTNNDFGVVPPGGTSGQVLQKVSSKDFDVRWGRVAIPAVRGKATALNQGAGTFTAPAQGSTADVALPDLTDAEDWDQLFPQVGDMRNLPIIFMMRGILHMKKSTDEEYATDKMMVVCDWLGFYTHDGKNPEGIDMKTIRASIGGFIPLRLSNVSSGWFPYIESNTLPELAMMADWEEPISPFPGQECMRPIFDPQGQTLKVISNSDMTAGDTYDYYWDFYLYY